MQGFGYNGQLGNGIMNEMGDGKEYVSLPTQVSAGQVQRIAMPAAAALCWTSKAGFGSALALPAFVKTNSWNTLCDRCKAASRSLKSTLAAATPAAS